MPRSPGAVGEEGAGRLRCIAPCHEARVLNAPVVLVELPLVDVLYACRA